MPINVKHPTHKTRNYKLIMFNVMLIVVLVGVSVGFYFIVHGKILRKVAITPSSDVVSLDEPPSPSTSKPAAIQKIKIELPTLPDYRIPPVTNGLAPVISTIPTKQNVVFLGIDDGANKQPFEFLIMKNNNVKASLFLANIFIKSNPDFFKYFMTEGSFIENHTINHRYSPKLTFAEQKNEICGEADLQLQQFGRRPTLFRPPGGFYNRDTRRAAAACGMKAVVLWIAKANGGSMQYQVGHSLRPGDIVLMHFRPEFAKDMQAFLDAEKAAGLHTALLEDWVQTGS